MYRLRTDNGDYALKLLNPVIMKRPDVFENYDTAEKLEYKLQAKGIPIVPALEYNKKKMQRVDNQYFYLFEWTDGKSLPLKKIKKEHCEKVGGILAKIHKIECEPKSVKKKIVDIDWDFYIKKAETICPSIYGLLAENRDLLYKSQREGNDALDKLPNVTCISNGDMDSKNVLWIKGTPMVIDLESLCYGNPYTEMFQLALCWSGYEDCRMNYELFKAFVESYIEQYGKFDIDCTALYSSNTGRLEWLEYNVKRALMIECTGKEEQKLGIEQVNETIAHIIYYDKIRDVLISQLDTVIHGKDI